jgi:autotransporter passenger strand-loop-strand repeat protein
MASSTWNGGSGGWGTIANWTGGVPNAATADATIAASGSYIVTVESGDTYTIDSVGVSDGGALLDVVGTLSLAGALALANITAGTLELAGVLAGGTLDIQSGATLLAAGGALTGEQDFYQGGSGVIALGGSTLKLGGTSTLQGYITGPGELIISGLATLTDNPDFEDGTTLDDAGTIILASNADFGNNGGAETDLLIGANKLLDITGANGTWSDSGVFNVTNAGLFEMTAGGAFYNINYNSFGNTGTISIVSGSDIGFYGATLGLGGTVLGPGEIYLGNSSGTVSLESGLVFNTGTMVAVGGDSVVLQANLSLGGEFVATYNANIDLNSLDLTLTGAADAVRSFVYGGGTLDIAGTANVGGLYLASGTEELITGTAIDDYYTRLDFDNGTAASVLSIASTGTYDITAVNEYVDYNGKLGTFINAGLLEATETQASYFNLYDNFTNASTGTILVNAGDDISLLYGQDSLAGTIEGPGALYIGQHATASLAASLVINIAYLTISDGNTDVILGGNTTFANEFTEQNSANISLNGKTLTVSGSGALDGYISGPGTVDITGTYNTGEYFSSGVTEVLTGTMYQSYNIELDDDLGGAPSVLSIAAGAVYNMQVGNGSIYNGNNNGTGTGTIVNAGLFENTQYGGYDNIYTNFVNASTGTISVLPYDDISLLTGQNQLGGTITGLGGFGELYLGQGSHTTLEAGLALSIGEVVLTDSNTNLDLAANQTYAGTFVMQGDAVIYATGHTFTLTGPAYLNNAYIAGPGGVKVTGFGDISGLVLTETGELIDSGDLNQTGNFQIANGTGDSGQLVITSGGTFALLNNNGINDNGNGVITNQGLFEKTGDNGYSAIYPRFNNAASGTLDVADGVLGFYAGGNLGGTITGAGQVNLVGGTFTLAAKAVVNVGVFAIDGGVLTEIGNHTITSIFEDVNNDLYLGGFNLTIGNGYLENAYASGPGALIVTGSDVLQSFYINNYGRLIDSGTITQQNNLELGNFATDNAALSITTAGIYDLVDNGGIYANGGLDTVVNAGLLEKTSDDTQSNINISFTNTSHGTIDAAIGVIALNSGSIFDKIAGTLMGAGEIDLDNNNILLSAKDITVATLVINASPTLGNNISYGGAFYLQPSDELNLNGYTLNLTGTDYLQGGLGGGTITVAGTGLVNLLNIQGGSDLIDTGLMEQINNLRFGYYYDGTQNTLAIAAGGIYEILDDSSMSDYINGTASANIYNFGLLEKTGGDGISEIQPTLTNTGTVLAAAGTIQFDNPADLITGTLTEGIWEVSGGGVLLFESSAPITVDAADIVISGKGSNIYSGPTAGTSLLASLTSIAAGGTLQLISAGPLTNPLSDAGTLILSGGTVTGLSVVSGGVSDILSGGVASATTVFNGGAQDVFNGGKAKFAVVSSGGMEFVSSGGIAISTTIKAHGSSTVIAGGVASNVTIAGGTFDLLSGGTATGFIDFTGTGGELIIGSKTMPTTTISGFVHGDTIDLAGVTYATGATVTVATASVVSIIDSGKTYSLNIAGATVGETDFVFGPGSLLTKTNGAVSRMTFVTPTSAAATTQAAAMLQPPSPVTRAPAPPALSSAATPSAATDLLAMVANGGSQIMPVTLTAS